MPTPPTSTTAVSGARAATGPADEGDHRCCVCRFGRCGGDGLLEAVLARGRARCGRWRARGRRRRRPAWAARRSRSSRVTMAPTCALSARPLPVTAALTSLGVCRATGRPRRAAHSMATALAWAVPITVRTLCWLNTRSTATTSGRCSSSHSSMPCSIGDEPVADLGVGGGAHDADAGHGQRPARRRRRPRRRRTGSAPGPRRARATLPPLLASRTCHRVPAGYRAAPTTRRADGDVSPSARAVTPVTPQARRVRRRPSP